MWGPAGWHHDPPRYLFGGPILDILDFDEAIACYVFDVIIMVAVIVALARLRRSTAKVAEQAVNRAALWEGQDNATQG